MKYRKTNVAKWADAIHMSMSTEQQHLFDYLNTNPYTRMCGIHPISYSTAAKQCGHTEKGFINLFLSFCKHYDGLIFFDDESMEYILYDWVKVNINTSPKIISAITSQIEEINSHKLLWALNQKLPASRKEIKRVVSNRMRSLTQVQNKCKTSATSVAFDNQPVMIWYQKELKNVRTKELKNQEPNKYMSGEKSPNDDVNYPNSDKEQMQLFSVDVPLKKPNFETPKKVAEKKGSVRFMSEAIEVLRFLNELTGRKFASDPEGKGRMNGTNNIKLVLKLFKKVGNFEDIKDMILWKAYQWKDKPMMKQYLQPSTLFSREKSFAYVQEACEARENPELKTMIDEAKVFAQRQGLATGGLSSKTAQSIYESIF